MASTSGAFTIEDFRRRAVTRGLPLLDADIMAPPAPDIRDAPIRGDHDLNGGFPMDGAPLDYRLAAVLVPVIARDGEEATILFTVRAAHLPSHAGQISFPGGKVSAADTSIVHTALRETQEETGLAPAFTEPIARLESYHTRSGFKIVPILALVSPGFTLRADPSEVADIFEVPLRFLMCVDNHRLHSRQWQGRERHFHAMPYGERYIWGATAGILRIMYERLYAE